MNIHQSELVLKTILQNSDDGFIVVDKNGIVLEINEQYAKFFVKKREDIIGHPIEQTITTTTMYDVLRNRKNDLTDVHMQHYYEGDVKISKDIYIAGKRFCVYNEKGDLVGAVAQMKFNEQLQNIERHYKRLELEQYEEFRELLFRKSGFDKIIGDDAEMLHVKRMGARAAQTDFPVLITGETGTGKELLAKSIHLASERKDGPYVAINCGAIPENLLESELFGYEKGAFTGASKDGKPGKFELANGGTFFLDEIGDMPLAMQVKLLRVLQEHELERVGGNRTIPLNVRIIAATRRNLPKMVEEGTFREDLFYRLAVVNIQTVPLRKCPGDILSHAYSQLDRLNQQYRTNVIFSEVAKQCLMLHSWPGNVRELQNIVSSAYAMCDNEIIEPADLPLQIARTMVPKPSPGEAMKNGDPASSLTLKEKMNNYELLLINDALESTDHNMTDAARLLGIERSLLYKKLNKFKTR